MNKELVSFFSIFIALFIGAIYYTNIIQSPFINTLNYIKSTYHTTITFIDKNINKHFNQATQITDLNEEIEKFENNHLVMQQLASEVSDLFRLNNSDLRTDPKVELVRTISYKKFGDLNKLWLDTKELNSTKVYGLVYNELVAGIVIPKNGRSLALLNKDSKSTYAVYIGKFEAPGIAHGNNSKNLIVKFIPAWFKINKGDEVVTSGLDDIFFKGLKVGKVVSVSNSQGYQNAIIEPYYKANNPNYFYMIKDIK